MKTNFTSSSCYPPLRCSFSWFFSVKYTTFFFFFKLASILAGTLPLKSAWTKGLYHTKTSVYFIGNQSGTWRTCKRGCCFFINCILTCMKTPWLLIKYWSWRKMHNTLLYILLWPTCSGDGLACIFNLMPPCIIHLVIKDLWPCFIKSL